MNLRLRLTLVVAVTFALVVVGCTYAAHVTASSRLRSETDHFLLQRSTRFATSQPNEFPQNGGDGDEVSTSSGSPTLADPDAIVRILDAQGHVHSSIKGQPTLPIDANDRLPRSREVVRSSGPSPCSTFPTACSPSPSPAVVPR